MTFFKAQALNEHAFYFVVRKPRKDFSPSFDSLWIQVRGILCCHLSLYRKNFLLCVCSNQCAYHFTLWQNDIEKAECPIIKCKCYACHFERLWIPSFMKFSIEDTLGQNTPSVHQYAGNSKKSNFVIWKN